MPNLPIRNLGAAGVVTDIDPFNLPFNTFTRAKNVRFTEGNVEKAPIFRNAQTLTFDPVFCMGISQPGAYDTILLADSNFNIHEYANTLVTQVYTNPTPASSVEPVTGTTLANVEYLNRPDHVPLYRGPTQTTFSTLPNWPSNHRCASIRSYGDFLIALNTTENGQSFPNRVRFSDPVLANSVPDTWDEADTTNSAGFNDLVQMQTPIVDGATLGTNFMIYSSDQVWQMEFVGGTFIFNFRKVFDDAGIINKNCVVEVEGRHYVFDNDDIYVNDGVTRQSICDQRIRNYVFNGLDKSKANRCFVQHNTLHEEIYFCYHTGDDMAIYMDSDSCNRAAVYNYRDNNWSFIDLPNCISGTSGNLDTVLTYATTNASYALIGGTYLAQESRYTQYPLMISRQNTADGINSNRMLAIDNMDKGTLSLEYADDISTEVVLERKGIDLDEAQIPLSGYKVIKAIYPQVSSPGQAATINFVFGAHDVPNSVPNYDAPNLFDIQTGYKVDTRASGRYLSFQVTSNEVNDFTLSGMDIDLVVTGRR